MRDIEYTDTVFLHTLKVDRYDKSKVNVKLAKYRVSDKDYKKLKSLHGVETIGWIKNLKEIADGIQKIASSVGV